MCLHLKIRSVWSLRLEDQQSLLLKLKQTLIFNPASSSKLVWWNSSTNCCSWAGVTCGSSGQVIGLDLSHESISGGIDTSSSLFDLHHLQSLNLAWNKFNGSRIPSGLDKLANLRHLNLSNSEFAGQIPAEISSLTRLVSLDISISWELYFIYAYPILKLENPNLSMLVRNLTRLTELHLEGTNASAQGHDWCRVLSLLPRLRVLNLANCLLTGPIDSSLAKSTFLSVFHLNGNNLSAPVPEFFGNFSNLTSLDLMDCGLYGNFPAKVFQLPTLQSLDISSNPLLRGTLPEFPENGSLQTLVLSSTNFSGTIPDSIGNLKVLSRIDLSFCKFRGSIPDTTAKLLQLVSLDFSYNGFSGPIPSFSLAKNISELNLANNQLTGSILSTDWSALSKLVSIDLHNNSLNGTLPTSLFGMPSLQRIKLNQNQFSGGLNVPSELASVLRTLDLEGNKLVGPFPEIVFQLQSLKILVLSYNNFSGPVKLSSFQPLRNLSTLDLSYNSLLVNATGIDPALFPQISALNLASCKLTGFPDFLKKQSQLCNLDLSANQIDGEIPSWIWNSTFLSHLNLSHNFLVNLQDPKRGPISAQYLSLLDLRGNKLQGQLPNLPPSATYVDFSSNKFSSVIPVNIGDYLEFAYFLSLSNNNIHGSIPKSICNGTYLHVLDLSNNSIGGIVPQCLTRMKSLGVLSLSENRLNGSISDSFSSNCAVQTLDLNGNQIGGKIPRSLANCQNLMVFDIGKNEINDTFPCHLKNISSLRVLILRSNYFYGRIDCPNDNYSWPILQIVDLASNHFSGELPQQCLRTWKAMIDNEDELQNLRFKIFDLDPFYYQNAIMVTMKSVETRLAKILTIFTSIDLSCNNFVGKLPEVIGEFKALHILNLSHNSLTGLIPSSIGNLRQLESLDLSSNNLSGKIPQQLSNLNFLEVLNLSDNQLEGMIPTGNQLQTFSEDSFIGNKGLCGVPLKENCRPNTQPSHEGNNSDHGTNINWNLLSVEVGFVFGLAIVILPLMFWKRWRIWYYKHVDSVLFGLLPQLSQTSRIHGRRALRTHRRRN
ncbi:hypothetical protein SLEP1_g50136 [Rubroshorea leprosula]|uniref:Leucine-rich repeat-containing N-terminal plant-type domain-containing protein n=1 Tax=Rubroshorea leprosula TaxID=152421 RepID=A0AAV5M2D1_9ROSI|nr:hypothetical protein SLEP1_g50136 [Rubroshorea leprosula]